MTDNDGSQDHATPSRGAPQSLIPWARRLYEQGKAREQVVREIYGVDFPAEVYLLRDTDGPDLPLDWLNQAWWIMTPLEQGGPKVVVSPNEDQYLINAYAQAPHVALLMVLWEDDAIHGDSIIGYDLDELRAGRSTVVGLLDQTDVPESGAEFKVFGPSLLQVLHEWLTNQHEMLAWRLTRESNRGCGSIDHDDVDQALQCVQFIEGLRKQLE